MMVSTSYASHTILDSFPKDEALSLAVELPDGYCRCRSGAALSSDSTHHPSLSPEPQKAAGARHAIEPAQLQPANDEPSLTFPTSLGLNQSLCQLPCWKGYETLPHVLCQPLLPCSSPILSLCVSLLLFPTMWDKGPRVDPK